MKYKLAIQTIPYVPYSLFIKQKINIQCQLARYTISWVGEEGIWDFWFVIIVEEEVNLKICKSDIKEEQNVLFIKKKKKHSVLM